MNNVDMVKCLVQYFHTSFKYYYGKGKINVETANS